MSPEVGNVDWVLMLFAVVCFGLDAFGVTLKRVGFFSLAFMFIALTFVI